MNVQRTVPRSEWESTYLVPHRVPPEPLSAAQANSTRVSAGFATPPSSVTVPLNNSNLKKLSKLKISIWINNSLIYFFNRPWNFQLKSFSVANARSTEPQVRAIFLTVFSAKMTSTFAISKFLLFLLCILIQNVYMWIEKVRDRTQFR